MRGPGRCHACEPDDCEDQLDATWFEHVDGEEAVYVMPDVEDALHRLHWHEAQLWRLGYTAGLPVDDVAPIVHGLLGQVFGEEEAYIRLEASLNAAGHDTYNSDTRFLVFPRGVRKQCGDGRDECAPRPATP